MAKKKPKSKIASAFAPRCPSCHRTLYVHDDGRVDKPWPCLVCAWPMCALCYTQHTADEHPNMNVVPREELE